MDNQLYKMKPGMSITLYSGLLTTSTGCRPEHKVHGKQLNILQMFVVKLGMNFGSGHMSRIWLGMNIAPVSRQATANLKNL